MLPWELSDRSAAVGEADQGMKLRGHPAGHVRIHRQGPGE